MPESSILRWQKDDLNDHRAVRYALLVAKFADKIRSSPQSVKII